MFRMLCMFGILLEDQMVEYLCILVFYSLRLFTFIVLLVYRLDFIRFVFYHEVLDEVIFYEVVHIINLVTSMPL